MTDNAAERELREVRAQLSGPPPQAAVRNINRDVHEGYAPQRPYAALEDRLAGSDGWQSFEQLMRALPAGKEIYQRDDGVWVRKVVEHTGESFMRDGKLVHKRRRVERGVALTKAQARAASAGGVETDYFNGSTWLRRGVKPELDMAVALSQPRDEDVFFEEAPAEDQALAQAQVARAVALGPVVPQAPAAKKGDK